MKLLDVEATNNNSSRTETVLRGELEILALPEEEAFRALEELDKSDDPAASFVSRACGGLRPRKVVRKRKNRPDWICYQWYLHWEEPGGKKRSRYVAKNKLNAVKQAVYLDKWPIVKTLELLK